MSNIKKGAKLTVSTGNGISRHTTPSLGVLEVSGPAMSDTTTDYTTNTAQLTIGATDVSGVLKLGINTDGNTFIDAIKLGNHTDIIMQKYGGDVIIGSGASSIAKVGIRTNAPDSTFNINSTDGLIIPVGTNDERPNPAYNGMIRYNTTTSQFEGYGPGSAWGSLGGVKDVNGDTYILAETTAGANNDDLQFFTAGQERMIVRSTGNVGIGESSPSYKLDVNGNARFVNSVTMNDNLTVDDYVGIGNIDPSNNLHVSGTGDTIARFTTTKNTGTGFDWIGSNMIIESIPSAIDNGLWATLELKGGLWTTSGNYTGTMHGAGITSRYGYSPNYRKYCDLYLYTSDWTSSTPTKKTRMILTADGKVGIGLLDTEIETYNFDVSGTTRFRNDVTINQNVGIGTSAVSSNLLRIDGNPNGAQIYATGASYGIQVKTNNSTTLYCAKFIGNTGKGLEVLSNGKTKVDGNANFTGDVTMDDNLTVDYYVGIGIAASSSYKLYVSGGNSRFTDDVQIDGRVDIGDGIRMGIATVRKCAIYIDKDCDNDELIIFEGSRCGARFKTNRATVDNSYFDYCLWATGSSHAGLIVLNNGNVGIGSGDSFEPRNKLDVQGGVVIGSSYSETTDAPSNGLLVEGQVGIGTDTITSDSTYPIAMHCKGGLSLFTNETTGNDEQSGHRAGDSNIIFACNNYYTTTQSREKNGLIWRAYGSISNNAVYDKTTAGIYFTPEANYYRGGLSFWTNSNANSSGAPTERIRITNTGKVGIGTTAPINKLDVEGAVVIGSGYSGTRTASTNGLLVEGNTSLGWYQHTNYPLYVHGYTTYYNNIAYLAPATWYIYNSSQTTHWDDTESLHVSIYSQKAVYSGNTFAVSSDIRIKENITEVPDKIALDQLRQIEVKYYEYIDKINRDSGKTIGFIAQQVKTVIPMAVKLVKDYIPVMKLLTDVTWTEIIDLSEPNYKLTSELQDVSGVSYQFIVSNDLSNNVTENIIVTGNHDNTFTFKQKWEHIFCHCKEIEDFHSLDKQKLFALNFSATQEIDRIQQQHIIDISNAQATIQTHQTDLSNANTTIQTLQTDLSTANTTIQQHETTIQQQQQQIADILSRLENLEATA